MTTRRQALAMLGALVALPAASFAQTAAGMRRIAWLGLGPLDAPSPYLDALRAELHDLGWDEGRNLTIARFSSTRAPDDFEQVGREVVALVPLRRDRPQLAERELVGERLQVALLVREPERDTGGCGELSLWIDRHSLVTLPFQTRHIFVDTIAAGWWVWGAPADAGRDMARR